MKTPKYLQPGDGIALIAPSFGCTTEPYYTRLHEAIKNLKIKYKIHEGPNIFKAILPYASNTAEERAREFMEAYQSNATLILSVGGGEMMKEILPFIDFEMIKKLPPKWFMGFSDNTNLTYTLTTIADVETIYGVNACDFAFAPYTYAALDAMLVLEGKKKVLTGYPYYEKEKIKDEKNPLAKDNLDQEKIITPNDYRHPVTGILLGGNLDILQALCGTPYDKTREFIERHPNDKIIWFLEACDLSPHKIQNAYIQLRDAGWFKNAAAFLIGRPGCMDDETFGITSHSSAGLLNNLEVPVYLDIDLGHLPPSMPFITGRKATVNYQSEKQITITYET